MSASAMPRRCSRRHRGQPVSAWQGKGGASMSDGGESATEFVSADGVLTGFARNPTSRRAFIKGVIASGAAVPATTFIFRGHGVPAAYAQTSGAVERLVTLNVNGRDRRVDVLPQETL